MNQNKPLFERKLNTVKREIIKLRVFEIIIFSVFAFALSLLFSLAFLLSIYLTIALTAIFIILFITKTKEDHITEVEKKYKKLKERLTTAEDNKKESNIIVDGLLYNVSKDLSAIGGALFMNSKRDTALVFATIVICFLLLIFTILGFEGMDLGKLFGPNPLEISTGGSGPGGGGKDDTNEQQAGGSKTPLLFDKESIAELEGASIPFYIAPEYSGEGEGEFNAPPSRDVEVSENPQGLYEEEIPAEYEEIVKDYFQKLTENG